MRVLVAEDDPLIRRWLSAAVADGELSDDVELLFADAAAELAAICAARPDCVVVDAAGSCRTRGRPLWDELAQLPDAERIPVVLYSSSRAWRQLPQLCRTRVSRVLPPSFTPRALLDAARAAMATLLH